MNSIFLKTLKSPPHITLKRINHHLLAFLKLRWKRQKDFYYSTFLESAHADVSGIRPRFKLPALSLLKEQAPLLSQHCHHYLQHEFNLLGSGWIKVIPPADFLSRLNASNRKKVQTIRQLISTGYETIDWQIDFRSGHRWREETWFKDIVVGEVPGADIKMPWELSRLQHLPQLALAYKLAEMGELGFQESQHYQLEICNQILDFISANPPRFGVNWACTMDVAIRLVNMIATYDLLVASNAQLSDVFIKQFVASIQDHAVHIRTNLEWASTGRGNHYLCNIVGLLFAAAWLPESEETKEWLSFGVQEFLAEIPLQFNADGSNVEGSTCYHRLSAEAVLWTAALLLGISETKIEPYKDKLRKMVQFTKDITKPDGTTPQIGDNDNGRLLKFLPSPENDIYAELRHDVLVSMGEALFLGNVQSVEASILKDLSHGRVIKQDPLQRALSYPDFGLYILKKGDFQVFVRCGGGGWYTSGNHTHNDQLSFDLCVAGKNIISDTGSYVYSSFPELRNKFRSTEMHNTCSLQGMEQNLWPAGRAGLFKMSNRAHGRLLQFEEDFLEGEHDGYGVPYRRSFKLEENGLMVTEQCKLKSKCVIMFHLEPGVEASYLTKGILIQIGALKLVLSMMEPELETGVWSILNGDISLFYGHKMTTKVIKWEGVGANLCWAIKKAK